MCSEEGQPCLQQDFDERCNTSDRIIAVFVVTVDVSTEGSRTCNMYRLASSYRLIYSLFLYLQHRGQPYLPQDLDQRLLPAHLNPYGGGGSPNASAAQPPSGYPHGGGAGGMPGLSQGLGQQGHYGGGFGSANAGAGGGGGFSRSPPGCGGDMRPPQVRGAAAASHPQPLQGVPIGQPIGGDGFGGNGFGGNGRGGGGGGSGGRLGFSPPQAQQQNDTGSCSPTQSPMGQESPTLQQPMPEVRTPSLPELALSCTAPLASVSNLLSISEIEQLRLSGLHVPLVMPAAACREDSSLIHLQHVPSSATMP